MKKQTLSKDIRELYLESGLSAREIAVRLNTTIKIVYSDLRRNGIARRKAQEYTRITFERKPLSFSYKTRLQSDEQVLCNVALAIYWCEGFQTEKATGIDFANSNPEMVKIFVAFLNRICQVDKKRLRCYLYCYSNQDQERLLSFWSKTTGIPRSQFTKPYVRTDYRLDKINKMPYGLVHIRYADKKLLRLVKENIEAMAKRVLS